MRSTFERQRHAILCILWMAAIPTTLLSQNSRVREHYTKYEFRIPMRDGVRLFSSVYVPKDASKTYPFLLTRTPYSVGPYGADNYRSSLGPSPEFDQEGFIFVYQDARGRHMSEGEFVQARPHNPAKSSPNDIDESTDTYDTIEWLLKNIRGHNGRVGMVGISQPGFHVAASMIDPHPALKAASPQAPTADYYMGDDIYHNGAFMLAANYWFYSFFRPRPGEPAPPAGRQWGDPGVQDGYAHFLSLPPLTDVNARLFEGKARYWQDIIEHTTYDAFWQQRSLWKHMSKVSCAVLNVGGWYDAEDPMGAFHIYRAVEKNNPRTFNVLVMGPWEHGGWARGKGDSLGHLGFGIRTGEEFRSKVQFPFFMKYLKDTPADIAEATMFLTGINEFRRLPAWPPPSAKPRTFYLDERGRLSAAAPRSSDSFDEYVSDPNRPVPYIEAVVPGMTGEYITEDQRFASRRPDVLVYSTEPLEEDLIIGGPIRVKLTVSTSGTDADFVVKLIDVHPDGPTAQRTSPQGPVMAGYQQLVRGEPFRGKYRTSFEKPEPFVPGQAAEIAFDMPDVYHAFRRGHRIMVHVQSSWFPLVDRNPQQFMEIPKATSEDFQKQTHRVYRSTERPSSITVLVP